MAKPPRRARRRARRRGEPFQPLRTLAHIAALQSIFYATACILILFTVEVAGTEFSFDLIFSWSAVRGDTTVGWTLGIVWLLTAAVMIIAQVLIIARSKLVIDFTATLHFLHFLVVSLYEHELPRSWLWWGLQALSGLGMAAGGVWACSWRELRPMTFGIGEYEMVEQRAPADSEAAGGPANDPSSSGGGSGAAQETK